MDLLVVNLADHSDETAVLFIDREEFFFIKYHITAGNRYIEYYNQHTAKMVSFNIDADTNTTVDYIPKSDKMYVREEGLLTIDLPSISFTTESFSMLTISDFAVKYGPGKGNLEAIKHHASYILGRTTIR